MPVNAGSHRIVAEALRKVIDDYNKDPKTASIKEVLDASKLLLQAAKMAQAGYGKKKQQGKARRQDKMLAKQAQQNLRELAEKADEIQSYQN